MPINQPSNVIKLTNVSVVRLKKQGKRFEIACFKNKVKEWRTGLEKDLSEVLQISQVFLNVSKGQVAPNDQLQKAFGHTNVDDIVLEILNKGEVQVGDKERTHQLEGLKKEVATLVAEMCIDPSSQKPIPVTMIEKAMAQVHFGAQSNKSAKSQALDLIKTLQDKPDVLPIARAQMRIRITLPSKQAKKLKEQVMSSISKTEDDDYAGDEWELVGLIDPGQFKVLNDLLNNESKNTKGPAGRIETLNFAVVADQQSGDGRIE